MWEVTLDGDKWTDSFKTLEEAEKYWKEESEKLPGYKLRIKGPKWYSSLFRFFRISTDYIREMKTKWCSTKDSNLPPR